MPGKKNKTKWTKVNFPFGKAKKEERQVRVEEMEFEDDPELHEMITRLAERREELFNHPFYFIGDNILYREEGNEPVPREIAIVRYTLAEGVQDVFHRFIAPVEIPLDGKMMAKELSEIHHIPYIAMAEGESYNYAAVYHAITEFVRPCPCDCGLILFSREDLLRRDRGCLKWLYDKADVYLPCFRPPSFRPFSSYIFKDATLLLMELRACAGDPFELRYDAIRALGSPKFDMLPRTLCDFHRKEDAYRCAQCYAMALAYHFSLYLLEQFKIEKKEGHFPPEE